MNSTTPPAVYVAHLDWGTLSDFGPTIMAAPDEANTYAPTARYIVDNARPWLDREDQEAFDAFYSEHPHNPATATPEDAKAWVDSFNEAGLLPIITIERVEVLSFV